MKKIIYIDDEIINLELFRINLRNHYEITVTDSPVKALEIIDKERIDVIVTDYKMPVMNGMQLINNVKNNINPQAVCILLSGFIESELDIDKSKVFLFIKKPYRKTEMIEQIELAFSQLQGIA